MHVRPFGVRTLVFIALLEWTWDWAPMSLGFRYFFVRIVDKFILKIVIGNEFKNFKTLRLVSFVS